MRIAKDFMLEKFGICKAKLRYSGVYCKFYLLLRVRQMWQSETAFYGYAQVSPAVGHLHIRGGSLFIVVEFMNMLL